jgi:hypothetical protein
MPDRPMTEDRSPRLPSIPEPHRRCDRVLRQFAGTLIAAGFRTLGEQAKVFGLSQIAFWQRFCFLSRFGRFLLSMRKKKNR